MSLWGVWVVDDQDLRFSSDREAFEVRHLVAPNPDVCVMGDSTN